jgi:hypothetical protein
MIGRLLRTITLLSAIATATMPGLLAVVEGAREATATAAASAHVEAAGGSESCPVVHDAHCAACSMLRHGHTGPATPCGVLVRDHAASGVPPAAVPAADALFRSSGTPRAPPVA